jgi:hypothetical protein
MWISLIPKVKEALINSVAADAPRFGMGCKAKNAAMPRHCEALQRRRPPETVGCDGSERN